MMKAMIPKSECFVYRQNALGARTSWPQARGKHAVVRGDTRAGKLPALPGAGKMAG
jgi:hypothetical protein